MQPPQSIEEIKAGLETTEKGGVRQSIRNCLTVFQRDPLLSGAIAYNILTDRKDIIKPIGFHRESTALNDTDMKYRNVLVALIASQCGGVKMNVMKHHSRLQACSSWQDQSGNLKVYGEIGLLERGKAVSFLI